MLKFKKTAVSKRKKRVLKDEAVKKISTITLFASFAQQFYSPQSQEALVTQSDGLCVNSQISLPALNCIRLLSFI